MHKKCRRLTGRHRRYPHWLSCSHWSACRHHICFYAANARTTCCLCRPCSMAETFRVHKFGACVADGCPSCLGAVLHHSLMKMLRMEILRMEILRMEILRTNLAFSFGDMYSHIRSFARFTSYPVPHAPSGHVACRTPVVCSYLF